MNTIHLRDKMSDDTSEDEYIGLFSLLSSRHPPSIGNGTRTECVRPRSYPTISLYAILLFCRKNTRADSMSLLIVAKRFIL